ncbi:MAG: Trm112 family protein [Leptospirillum sp.]
MPIDPFLLSILVCPKCKGELQTVATPEGLACPTCHLLYPIKDEIPVMLVEEALPYRSSSAV